MAMAWAIWTVVAVAAYLGAGLIFGLAFAVAGHQRIDPAAANMPWPTRLLLVPGATLLWPLLLAKWIGQTQAPVA